VSPSECLNRTSAAGQQVAEVYRNCLSLADALYKLACIAYKEGRSAEALDHLGRALEVNPSKGACHRVLGLIRDETGDREKAAFHYKGAMRLDPSTADDDHVRRRLKELER